MNCALITIKIIDYSAVYNHKLIPPPKCKGTYKYLKARTISPQKATHLNIHARYFLDYFYNRAILK